jgi:Zn-dependent protease with chaperone function
MLAYMMLLQVKRLLMRWSVTAELSCDRAAMLVAQDVNVVVSTLLKVSLVKQSQLLQCVIYSVCIQEFQLQ